MSKEQVNTPEFDGNCAFALSIGKEGVSGLKNNSLNKNGKLYYFSNPVAKFLFKILPGTIEKAENNWK